jgi:hypothetical protein
MFNPEIPKDPENPSFFRSGSRFGIPEKSRSRKIPKKVEIFCSGLRDGILQSRSRIIPKNPDGIPSRPISTYNIITYWPQLTRLINILIPIWFLFRSKYWYFWYQVPSQLVFLHSPCCKTKYNLLVFQNLTIIFHLWLIICAQSKSSMLLSAIFLLHSFRFIHPPMAESWHLFWPIQQLSILWKYCI